MKLNQTLLNFDSLKNHVLSENEIEYLKNIKLINEHDLISIPYPQANNPQKLSNFMYYLSLNHILTEELASDLDVDKRQVAYYGNALKYLGFITITKDYYLLTSKGKSYLKADKHSQNKMLVDAFLSIPSIRASFIQFKINPDVSYYTLGNEIIKYRKDLSISTTQRRASTIKKWVKYIDTHINDCIQ